MKLIKLRKKHFMIAIPIILVLLVTSFLAREYFANLYVGNIMDEIEVPQKDDRVLVFAPHSDDEALGAATLIKKSIQNGAEVKVVLITNGDGFRRAVEIEYARISPKPSEYISFGYRRQKESENALRFLGVKESDVIFLGYPDGGISKMWRTNWMKNNPYYSTYTKTFRSPYDNSYAGKPLYAGENLYNNFAEIVEAFKPTDIVYPHPNDRHPDHWAVNAFVKYSLSHIKYTPEHEWLYLVHRGDWPTPLKRRRNMYLTPPMSILSTGTKWSSLSMSDKDIEEKSEALKLYKSQVKRISMLMSAFERKNELFGAYPDVKLTGYVRRDSEISINNDNLVIEDPAKDAIELEVEPMSDILGVYAETSIENNMHVFIQLDSKPGKKPTYYLNMIFFKPDRPVPLRLAINQGKLKAIKQNEDSITDVGEISIKTEGKTLHIIIPGSKVGNYERIFMNAESSIDSFPMDRTAWRMVVAYEE